jgi:hypothetical protein
MNVDLAKAATALEAGRGSEASVHAWNALATVEPHDKEGLAELRRIALELGENRLLRELERRGLAGAPEHTAISVPARRILARVAIALTVGAVAVLLAVTQVRVEPGPVRPTARDAVTSPDAVPRILSLDSGVWLVPVEPMKSVDLRKIADELTFRYGVPVGVQAAIVVTPSTVDAAKRRLVAEALIGSLGAAYGAEGSTVFIAVTDYDMHSVSEGHVFSLRREPHYAVVSTALLGATVLDRVRGHTRHERTRKLIARNMGFLVFRRATVEDDHSLLRPKMSKVSDIDKLDEDL